MAEITAEQIAQRAFDLDLLDERQLKSVWAECGSRDVPLDEFRNLLVRRELLTNYQVEKLLRGERTGFYYGDYKVLYLVGTGSFARVYRAVHRTDGRVVALKVLRKRFSERTEETEQFLREGRMGASLRHPNIVPIYEVHSVRRTYFLVMAFVEGQSLRDFVKIRKRLDPLEATEIMAGVVSGLVYAAEKGITHRDLKLSNVLISSDGVPQLVDFGLAAAEGSDEANPRTIDYAGLERATGVRKDDPRSDIYFAGCMYYHMLSGHAPLPQTRDRVQRMSVTRFKEVKPIRNLVPDIPPLVEATVTKSMHLDAEQRYSRPVEFLVDLRKAAKAVRQEEAGVPVPENGKAQSDLDSGITVLLVESNQTVQDAVRKGLKQCGF
ncbi:MAG: serine/threonine protein kinase, partial [Planctomycetales bacterium]|nr:serine/threonine protein kinase [Planctomycetales bacterium]